VNPVKGLAVPLKVEIIRIHECWTSNPWLSVMFKAECEINHYPMSIDFGIDPREIDALRSSESEQALFYRAADRAIDRRYCELIGTFW
jgi:hypothetical protein